jgi:exodeoxyribonuclease VII large subunit
MTRLPFDSGKIPAPKPPSGQGNPLTVTQASGMIRDALMSKIPGKVRIVGEISNFSARNHLYFSLKDPTATLRCVCFASSARKINCKMGDGIQVIATGRIDYFDQSGQVQLYVDNIEPVGQGSLEAQLKALMEDLRGKGYFAPERKKPLPVFPQRIVVITSRIGAALQDVLNTKDRRWPGCELFLLDTRVQGAQAAPEIARAIDAVSIHGRAQGIDAIILTRGGGSIEDLWAFNERIVADAIFRCPFPIVAAIGHETDTTVAELVADERCATPTQAAMKLVPERDTLHSQTTALSRRLLFVINRNLHHARQSLGEFSRHPVFRKSTTLLDAPKSRLVQAQARLAHALEARLLRARAALDRLASHPGLKNPENALLPLRARLDALAARHVMRQPEVLVAPHQDRLDALKLRLARVIEQKTRTAQQTLQEKARQLRLVGPDEVLGRGFTYTTDDAGKLIRSAGDAKPGQILATVFFDGTIQSKVTGADEQPSRGRIEAKPPARKPRRASREDTQGIPGLFDA